MNKFDEIFVMFIFIAMLAASFIAGQELTKKSFCEKSGKYWSYDLGQCFEAKEVLK